MLRLPLIIAAIALFVPTTAPVADSSPECIASPFPEEACSGRSSVIVAVGQTRLITPSFFDEGNRAAFPPDNLEWQFGPASIGAVLPIFGTASAEIRGDAVGAGELRLINLDTGDVLAIADVCVFSAGPGTEAVRAEFTLE